MEAEEQRDREGDVRTIILLYPGGGLLDPAIQLEVFKESPLFERIADAEVANQYVLVEVTTKEMVFLATAPEFVAAEMQLLMGVPDGEYNQNWYLYRAQFAGTTQYEDVLQRFQGAQEQTEESAPPEGERPIRKPKRVQRRVAEPSDENKAREERAAEPEFNSTADEG